MSDRDQSPAGGAGGNADEQPKSEHLNIKVTDNNNEVFFKIKRTTALSKLMNAFCDRQGKNLQSVRFLFDGSRVNPTDSPESVGLLQLRTFRFTNLPMPQHSAPTLRFLTKLVFIRETIRLTRHLARYGRRRHFGGPPRTDWGLLRMLWSTIIRGECVF